jgi:hypothetical protein
VTVASAESRDVRLLPSSAAVFRELRVSETAEAGSTRRVSTMDVGAAPAAVAEIVIVST